MSANASQIQASLPAESKSTHGSAGRTVTVPASSTASTPSSAYPPQSAAYPAMPTQLKPDSLASSAPKAATFVAPDSANSEQQASPAVDTLTGEEHAPAAANKDQDIVIEGRKGSTAGTIAVPADQTPVAWPAVPGAPPGYPGKPNSDNALAWRPIESNAAVTASAIFTPFVTCVTNWRLLLSFVLLSAYHIITDDRSIALCCRHSTHSGWPCPAPTVPRLHGQACCQSR